jgi:hypothetical protein
MVLSQWVCIEKTQTMTQTKTKPAALPCLRQAYGGRRTNNQNQDRCKYMSTC